MEAPPERRAEGAVLSKAPEEVGDFSDGSQLPYQLMYTLSSYWAVGFLRSLQSAPAQSQH